MNTVDWFSKMSSPEALSRVSEMEVTEAALPLSWTSRRRAVVMSVPVVGMGFLMERYCSPWRSLAYERTRKVSTCIIINLNERIETYGVEVRQPIERQTTLDRHLGNNTKARQHAKVIGTLVHPLQLILLGADAKVVQEDVTLGVRVLADFLGLLGLSDDGRVFGVGVGVLLGGILFVRVVEVAEDLLDGFLGGRGVG